MELLDLCTTATESSPKDIGGGGGGGGGGGDDDYDGGIFCLAFYSIFLQSRSMTASQKCLSPEKSSCDFHF